MIGISSASPRLISVVDRSYAGGSDDIKFCANLYPSKANFEARKALGNEEWDAVGFASYFRKNSRFTPPSIKTSNHLSIDYTSEELHASWAKVLDRLEWFNTDDPIEGLKFSNFAAVSH
ncbi:GMC oxidoreductase [Stagonosporopsis vannaccii]|nr:GMC oxidoreductase [Stagonosporopsis vannaccii]